MRGLPKKRGRDYRHGDLKAALMDAALQSIARTGEVEFSLRDLSIRAGVTHAAAYRHFSSKKDILVAIAEQGHWNLSERFRSVLAKDPADIEGLGVTYVLFAVTHPCHFKVMFHPDVKANEADDSETSLGHRTFGFLVESIEANQKSGRFIAQDSRLIAMSAWAGVHGLSTLIVHDALEEKMKLDPKVMAKIMTKHFMSGFLKRK